MAWLYQKGCFLKELTSSASKLLVSSWLPKLNQDKKRGARCC